MADEDSLEKYYEHKKGDLVSVIGDKYPTDNEWEVIKYLIGGYEIKNTITHKRIQVETKHITFAEPDLNKVPNHENHEVVVTYVINPEYDRYLYCRTCKKEVSTRYKKLPKPKDIYFNR